MFKPKIKPKNFYTITNAVALATLPALIEQFVRENCESDHTAKAYINSLAYFQWHLSALAGVRVDALSFSDVTKTRIRDFYNARSACESQASADLRLRVVKAFCSWMARRFDVDNVGALIRGDKAPMNDFKGLNARQYKAFINQARQNKKPIERFIPLLLVGTGLRNNEARNLTISNLSADRRWLLRVEGKGGKFRNIPLTDDLCAELNIYLWHRAEYSMAGNTPLLLTSSCLQIANKTIWRIVRDTAVRAGISEDVGHPHALRHTFAYRALDWLEKSGTKVGRALIIVKDLLGHSDINTTMRYLGNNERDVFEQLRAMR